METVVNRSNIYPWFIGQNEYFVTLLISNYRIGSDVIAAVTYTENVAAGIGGTSFQGKLTIKYTVSRINMNPVPASKFDIPKTGYREMTYEESKKTNVSN